MMNVNYREEQYNPSFEKDIKIEIDDYGVKWRRIKWKRYRVCISPGCTRFQRGGSSNRYCLKHYRQIK